MSDEIPYAVEWHDPRCPWCHSELRLVMDTNGHGGVEDVCYSCGWHRAGTKISNALYLWMPEKE
jgi:hypothetical protein